MSGSAKGYVPPPIPFNPISKYEEYTEIEGVTLFELHGKPRTAETDPTVMKTLSTKVLDSELRCPICLMYLKNTHIVMLCLHRFCGDCIQKSIRIGKKECPSCRIHLPSRRSLRPDPNFDALIVTLYGDLDKLEENEAKEAEEINKRVNVNNALTNSQALGIAQQHAKRRLHKVTYPQASPRGGSTTASAGGQSAGQKRARSSSGGGARKKDAVNLVSFVLRKHPKEGSVGALDREYIRTSSELK
ncbi:hypothetical protein TrRE_jg945, partial [Triparma retinervis]